MESRVYRVAGVSAVLEPDFQAAPASGDGEARPAPDSQGALAEVPATSGARSTSNGLVWAMISLALDLIEVVVLVEIVFFDKPAFNGAVSFGFLHVYLVVMVAATRGWESWRSRTAGIAWEAQCRSLPVPFRFSRSMESSALSAA